MNRMQLMTIVGIVLVSGLIGGLGNYCLVLNEVPNIETIRSYTFIESNLFKSLLAGIIAAATMPALLSLVSSNVLEFKDNHDRQRKYLIFSGLCLVGAMFSDKFIDIAYNRSFDTLAARVAIVENSLSESNIKTSALVENVLDIDRLNRTDSTRLTEVAENNSLNNFETTLLWRVANQRILRKDSIRDLLGPQYLNSYDRLRRKNLIYEFNHHGDDVVFLNTEIMK